MFAIIFVAVFALFANESKALEAESICCEEIEALLKNKTTAYQTVCLGPDSRLSSNCCRNIEIEIEKHRYAYKTLCPAGMRRNHLTMVINTRQRHNNEQRKRSLNDVTICWAAMGLFNILLSIS